MGAKLPAIPRAEPSAGPVVQTAEQLPSATTKDLQGWFAQEEKHSAELSAWDEALRRVLEKRSAGIVLSTEELKFVARAFTALCDTPVNLMRVGMTNAVRAGFDLDSAVAQLVRAMQGNLDQDEAKVKEAWVELERALVRQVLEAHSARMSGRTSGMDTLRDFYAALEKLREGVKTHSATPEHRLQDDPERDQTIYLMRRDGKTYGEIALKLPKQNSRWRITAKQAERLEKRYRERGQTYLYQMFLKALGQPDDETPR